ncbi:glycosyltransferase [Candidatus Chloroploca sp. Khr17]|uniref:UDP-N-acetylglucosamine--N-acetylmuramyl- (pentapeptide) pyrophosphoryl-undecaprenol N-acetylglucosamine transferase n=1 Tax=Candidatus Chloroploca sp. Khr17 TaxID=2496869 RepID=UPI00101CFEE5|nr:UDP-N-acetylglucosamine--N-acetylmuramyl-(pentapeptide) pyrophosphoryl-undecaprenol N-acetylglucosamine transferase [Candidatus Chloroploca sp. Khr17]
MAPPCASSTILLCGGGTGGHVYPALAVAVALDDGKKTVNPGQAPVSLVYVGSEGGMEERIVARESQLPFRALPAAALRGRNPVALMRGLATMVAGTRMARRLLTALQPRAILGTGGYVCVPLFLAARSKGVPTMIYLPDVVPGLAVKMLSRIATLTAVNVEDALPRLGLQRNDARALVTGYPVRSELFGQDRPTCVSRFALDPALPVVLVYGGSRGARSINRAIAALLRALLERCQLIHVCGREGDEAWLKEAAAALPETLQARYRLYPYLEAKTDGASQPSMTAAFGAADLSICRSGASTLAELPAAALPAILVPYPYVHQDENADYLVERGAAVKVADAALLGSHQPEAGPLFAAITRLLDNPLERQRMVEQSRALARPDAARHLAEAVLSLAARSCS